MFKIYNIADDDVVAYPFQLIQFPGGEPHVLVEPKYIYGQDIWVDARVHNSQDFMSLLCLLDAISFQDPKSLSLFLPYFPGARQDRYEGGSCFTLGVYASCLSRYDLHAIVVADCHSKVTTNWLRPICDNVINLELADIFDIRARDYVGIIRPDQGAEDRTVAFADKLGIVIDRCSKVRDPKTGKLSGFKAPALMRSGKYLMVDDICDGGGTFVGLAQTIKNQTSIHYSIDLCVTHGIFSKGAGLMLTHFDKVITTDSFQNKERFSKIVSDDRYDITNLFWAGLRAIRRGFV